MKRETVISNDGKYRYTLWRDWSYKLRDQGAMTLHFTPDPHLDYYPGNRDTFLNFIMLNPSTADATQDDATIRRCVGFAQRTGFGAMCVTNLFAYRATDPEIMKTQSDPVGPENDSWLKRVAKEAGLIIAAWGIHGKHDNRNIVVRNLLCDYEIKCFGHTADGYPRHPVRLAYNTKMETLL